MPMPEHEARINGRGSGRQSTSLRFILFMLLVLTAFCWGNSLAEPGGLFLMEPFLECFFEEIKMQISQPHEHERNGHYCKLNNLRLALYSASIFIPGMIGLCLLVAFVIRKWGHRVSIFLGAGLVGVGVIVQISSSLFRGTRVLIAFRNVLGCGFSFLNQAVFTFLAEMAPPQRRVFLICAIPGLAKLAACLTNIMNYFLINHSAGLGYWSWILSLTLISIPCSFILVVISSILPAAPLINANITVLKSVKLLISREHIHALLTGILVPMFTQLVGPAVIGPVTYQALGFRPEVCLLIEVRCSAASCLSTTAVPFFVDKWGRKRFLYFGSVLMFLSLIALGLVEVITAQDGLEHNILCIVAVILYHVGFGISWGPLGALIPTEIYPPEIREVGMGVTNTTNYFFSGLISGFSIPLLCTLKYWIFFVLAGMVLLATLYVWIFLPETTNVAPDQYMPESGEVAGSGRRFIDDDEEVAVIGV